MTPSGRGAPRRRGHEDARRTGLTHRFTHSHTVILRLKIVPVTAAAAIYKAHALPLGEVEVPAGHHGPARPRQRLLGADSCVETVRRSAGQGSGFGAHKATDQQGEKGRVTLDLSEGEDRVGPGGPGQLSLSTQSSSFPRQGRALGLQH